MVALRSAVSPNKISRDNASSLSERKKRSMCAEQFGLLGGNSTGFTPASVKIAWNSAVNFCVAVQQHVTQRGTQKTIERIREVAGHLRHPRSGRIGRAAEEL